MKVIMVKKELINRIDNNNLKALGIIKHILFALNNGADTTELDAVSTLEAVQDYLVNTNDIFDANI